MASQLSNLTHKLADKIEQVGNKNNQNNQANAPGSTNYGPHSSNVANKVDPRVDSDRDGRNDPTSRVGGYGNTQAHDGYGTTTGPGGVASSDTYGSNTNNPAYNNPQSTNAGPHNSNMMNKLDPRVDSDRDGRNDPSSRVGGYGQTQHHNDGYSNATGPGGFGSSDTGYNTTHTGPTHTTTTTTHGAGQHTTHSSGFGGSNSAQYDNPQSANAGPHASNMMNKLDPRVDSDRDGRNNPTSMQGGYGQTQTGYGDNAGYGAQTTHHNTQHNTHGAQGYTGTNQSYDNPQSTNQGPHNSNLLNKLDPRVDSDRDGRDNPNSRAGGYGNTQTGQQNYY